MSVLAKSNPNPTPTPPLLNADHVKWFERYMSKKPDFVRGGKYDFPSTEGKEVCFYHQQTDGYHRLFYHTGLKRTVWQCVVPNGDVKFSFIMPERIATLLILLSIVDK